MKNSLHDFYKKCLTFSKISADSNSKGHLKVFISFLFPPLNYISQYANSRSDLETCFEFGIYHLNCLSRMAIDDEMMLKMCKFLSDDWKKNSVATQGQSGNQLVNLEISHCTNRAIELIYWNGLSSVNKFKKRFTGCKEHCSPSLT